MVSKCSEIQEYIDIVRGGEYPSCSEQFALCDLIDRVFETEDLFLDTEQLGAFLKLQKHFPYNLFPWEKFVFTLHNCLYTADNFLRFPDVFGLCGRGTGKNGYISFESFANLTPASRVKNYEIDIFATAEKQAKTSFLDVYNILESNKNWYKKYFYWNKEIIINLKTKNSLQYNTSSPKTKDGFRPGMLVFDEFHAYENELLTGVAEGGLGKVPFPKKSIWTTDGRVRGGPLDIAKIRANDILFKGADDLGTLPFVCKLPNIELVNNPVNWHMACPSLRYFPNLMNEMKKEYANWCLNPSPNHDFIVKRMNIPPEQQEEDVTSWENVLATNKEVPDLTGCPCIAAIDYAKTTDFVAAGLLFKHSGIYYWITHTWVCKKSADLYRIKAPLDDWAAAGLLEFVDDNEINPSIPVNWILEKSAKYNILKIGLDSFRYTLLSRAIKEAGLDKKLLLTKNVTIMRWAPVLISAFATQSIRWGDNPLMRWYTNNVYTLTDKKGNTSFEKKEPKSRKTDGFFALLSAFCASEDLPDCGLGSQYKSFAVYSY